MEMGFEENDGVKDAEKRTYDSDLIGFVCAGHTSHSGDAGKSRSIATYSRVRVLSNTILDCIHDIPNSPQENKDWTVYCMGLTFNTSVDGVWEIVYSLHWSSKR